MAICAVPAFAQEPGEPDAEGCKDSKLLTRMRGCVITACSAKEFDAVSMQVKAIGPDSAGPPTKSLEGQIEILEYACPAKLSPLNLE